jgi:hypothetical protein
VADTGRYADDLAALFEVLGEPPATLTSALVLVDELQEATSDDLIAVNTAVHQLGQADGPLPVTFVGAGLPSLPAQLAEATSYAERLHDYRPIGLLGEDAARAALVRPSLDHDVTWAADAITQALGIAGGYPYFLQAVGTCGTPPEPARSPWTTSRSAASSPAARLTRDCTDLDGSGPRRRRRRCCVRSVLQAGSNRSRSRS